MTNPKTTQAKNIEFQAIEFESAGEAIFIIDLDGRVIEANQAAVALFGYSPEELVGMSVEQLLGSYSLDFARVQLKQRASIAADLSGVSTPNRNSSDLVEQRPISRRMKAT